MALRKAIALALLVSGLVVVPGSAQQVAPVGVATLSKNATIGNGNVSVGATIFSGDLLKTGDQGGLMVQSGSLQFTLGPNSSVRLFRSGNRTLAEIESGTLAYAAKGLNEDLALYALDIRFVPKTSVPSAGEINIASRCRVITTAMHSSIEATSGRETKTIEETKSYTVLSEFGVDYKDAWQPVLTDYPDFPRDADYHHSHSHVACPAGVWNAKGPPPPLVGHFALGVGVGEGIVLGVLIHEVFESPDRP